MAFLSWLVKPIMDWLLGKILGAIAAFKKDQEDHQKAVNQAAQDSKKAKEVANKPDATKEQIDEAIDDQFKHL